MPAPITAPASADQANAHRVSQGPIQAPTPAISFTSPAPMPPIAYKGKSVKRPTAAPPADVNNSAVPPFQNAKIKPPAIKLNVSQLGTRSERPSMTAASIRTNETSQA